MMIISRYTGYGISLLLAIGVVSHAENNSIYFRQSGNHDAYIQQTGDFNGAGTSQVDIDQSGDGHAGNMSITQFGRYNMVVTGQQLMGYLSDLQNANSTVSLSQRGINNLVGRFRQNNTTGQNFLSVTQDGVDNGRAPASELSYGVFLGAGLDDVRNLGDNPTFNGYRTGAFTQEGAGNHMSFSIFGSRNFADADQFGNGNQVVTTGGGLDFLVFGDDNVMRFMQDGSFNIIAGNDLGMDGDRNATYIAQTGDFNETHHTISNIASDNTVSILQSQSYGSAVWVENAGQYNKLEVDQTGSTNGYVDAHLEASDNVALLNQSGQNSQIELFQTGRYNAVEAYQSANFATMNMVQNGTNDFISATQTGQNAHISVHQSD